jgi:hypothetical protein
MVNHARATRLSVSTSGLEECSDPFATILR